MRLLSDRIYRILRPLLFRLDAESANRLILVFLALWPERRPYPDPPELGTTVFGLRFSNPVGLAAGLDKDALAINAWAAMGFGFAELGTITPRPQRGNPRPRIWRLPRYRAMVNRLGFPSAGMEAAAARIATQRRGAMRIALNFGPNKETPLERVADDYAALMTRLGGEADFVVVNLSSPNTPGLRYWQAPERIRQIIGALRSASNNPPPLLIKIAPDLEPDICDEIARAASDLRLAGVVATNTTIRRAELDVISDYSGGLSGAPLAPLARDVIRRTYRATEGKLPIIGVGGIACADDAWRHLRAGASLVELYTGMIYQGPGLPASVKAGLVALVRQGGNHSIAEIIGADA
jgi:dihydroorotate dehydrogenase